MSIKAFTSKVICIGEIHGILEAALFQAQVIESYLTIGQKLIVLLERGIDEQKFLDDWFDNKKISEECFSCFFESLQFIFFRKPV